MIDQRNNDRWDKRVIDFVRKEFSKGYSEEQIRKALLNAGHELSKVDSHIDHARSLTKKRWALQTISISFVAVIILGVSFAIFSTEKEHEKNPDFTGPIWDMLREERYDSARDGFLQELQSWPDSLSAKAGLGIAYAELGEMDLSLPLLKEAVIGYPGDLRLRERYIQALIDAGRIKEAEENLLIAISIDPQGRFMNSLGWIYFNQESYEEAARQFASAVNAREHSGYIGLGRIALRDNDFEEAISYFEEAIDLVDSDPQTSAHYGLALMNAGRLEDAALRFFHAIDLDPSNELAHRGLGHVRSLEKRTDLALELYLIAIELGTPVPEDIHARIGRIYYVNGDFSQAIDSYRNALEYAPSSLDLRNSLSWSLYQEGRYEDAAISFNRLFDEAESAEYASGLGLSLHKLGRQDEAWDMLDHAVSLGNPYHAHVGLARISRDRGLHDRAQEEYSRALSIMEEEGRLGIGDISAKSIQEEQKDLTI